MSNMYSQLLIYLAECLYVLALDTFDKIFLLLADSFKSPVMHAYIRCAMHA